MFEVITVGSATLDIFLKGVGKEEILNKNSVHFRGLCVGLGEKNKVKEIFIQSGGGATNSATTFARSKLKVSSIFCLGDDIFGKKILKELILEEIDFSLALIRKKILTSLSIILVAPDGSRSILYYKPDPSKVSLKIPFSKIKTKWFYLSPLNGDLVLFKKILNYASQKKIFILGNPGAEEILFLKNHQDYLGYFDIFVLNQLEASKLTGVSFSKEKEIFQKLDRLTKNITIMTKGKKGAILSTKKFLYQIPCFPSKKIVDRTGAGDSFASGFLAGVYFLEKKYPEFFKRKIYQKKPEILLEAIRYASANATSVIENFGAKTGILSYQKFKKMSRFKSLPIKISPLT